MYATPEVSVRSSKHDLHWDHPSKVLTGLVPVATTARLASDGANKISESRGDHGRMVPRNDCRHAEREELKDIF
jgi:hypothetical protein